MNCSICGLPYQGEGQWIKVRKYKHFKRVCVPCYSVGEEEKEKNEPKNNL